ncbi:hypothetical protein ACFV1F_32525, partial [Streptomyces sp. NPDC059590]
RALPPPPSPSAPRRGGWEWGPRASATPPPPPPAGRYHNRRFLAIAEELGLDHSDEPHPSSGFSLVTLSPEARRRYRTTIDRLQRALKAHTVATAADTTRTFRGPAARHGSSGGGVRVKAVCDCGRNVRVVPSVLAQAPIMCGGCGKPFRIPEPVAAVG